MRFHVLSIPQIQTTRDYYIVGFTPKIVNFCRMMKDLGHEVILYGSEDNEAPCDENVVCITKAEQKKWMGNTPPVFAAFSLEFEMWREMNCRIIGEISRRKRPGDFICTLGGGAQKSVAEAHPDLTVVEFGVGYEGVFAPNVVWESHSWRQYVYGKLGATQSGRFWDTVIPGYCDPKDFPFSDKKGDYLLYCGRMVKLKGIDVATEVAGLAGVPIKMIGPLTPGESLSLPKHAEYLGAVSIEERAKLMGGARAVIMPTLYNEPFGTVCIESQFCGTPVITTDWGSFPELIENGVNGYRCNILRDFLKAIKDVEKLDPKGIRERVEKRHSLDVIRPQYQTYFERLSLLWGNGWYAD